MLKRIGFAFLFLLCMLSIFGVEAEGQTTTFSASLIQDGAGGGNLLSSGQLCIVGTVNNAPSPFHAGSGGMASTMPHCVNVTNGAIPSFNVASSSSAAPNNLNYSITVTDSISGTTIITLNNVQINGLAFNLDNYASLPPLPSTATSTGPLTVSGDLTATGKLVGSYINVSNISTSDYTINNTFEQGLNPAADSTQYQFGISSEMFSFGSNTHNFSGQQVGGYASYSHFGSGSAAALYGLAGEAFNSGPGTANLVAGVSGTANCGGVNAGFPVQTATNNGTCPNLRGGDFIANNTSTGNVTNAAGVFIESNHNTGGGTITNNYGILVADQTVGGLNYAIKTGLGLVSFGDALTTSGDITSNGTNGYFGKKFVSQVSGHQARFGVEGIGTYLGPFVAADTTNDFFHSYAPFAVVGNTNQPAGGLFNGNAYMVGGVGSPISGQLSLGDGSGYEYDFVKRSAGVSTPLFQFKDSGNFVAAGSIVAAQIAGTKWITNTATDLGTQVNSAISGLGSAGGKIRIAKGIYTIASGNEINANGSANLSIECDGGLTAGATPAVQINYSGTGTPIKAQNSAGFKFLGCMLTDTSATFVGPFIDLSGPTSNSALFEIAYDSFFKTGSGVAASIDITTDKANSGSIHDNNFQNYVVAIQGAATGASYSNAIKVEGNQFSTSTGTASGAHIRNPGQGWQITANTFEMGSAAGVPKVLDCLVANTGQAIHFAGNWIGDDNSISTHTLFNCGSPLDAQGNYIAGGGANTTLFTLPASSFLKLNANNLNNAGTGVDATAGNSRLSIGTNVTNSVTNLVTGTPFSGDVEDAQFGGRKFYGSEAHFGQIQSSATACTAPGFTFTTATTSGLIWNSNGRLQFCNGGVASWMTDGGGIILGSAQLFKWANATDPNAAGSFDTGFSRNAAGTVFLGNGTANDGSGTFEAARLVQFGDYARLTTGGVFIASTGYVGFASTSSSGGTIDATVNRSAAGVICAGTTGVNCAGTFNASGYQTNGTANFFSVSADFTTAASTSLQTITGLSFVLGANTAQKVPFSCHLAYSQATALAAVAFGIQSATIAPNQIFATGAQYTSATAATGGVLPALVTTTATNIVSATPSVLGTNYMVDIDGIVDNPSNASANTINLMVSTATAGDAVTVKKGSYCRLY